MEGIAPGVVDGDPCLIIRICRYLKFVIEACIFGNFAGGHEGGYRGLPSRVPDNVIEVRSGPPPAENARELLLRCTRMLLEIVQDQHVVFERGGLPVEVVDIPGKEAVVFFEFGAKGITGFGYLMAMVEEFDGLLDADGDAKADDDGGDVDEEVSPRVGRMLGRVNVEHRG
jgi:hypothetical protein